MMKAKVFVGPPESGKSRVAELIRDMNPDKIFLIDGSLIRSNVPNFYFSSVPDDCETLIMDNVNMGKRFAFEVFYSFFENGQIEITVEKRGQYPYRLVLKNLIIITESIREDLLDSASFRERFDVIEFPLTK